MSKKVPPQVKSIKTPTGKIKILEEDKQSWRGKNIGKNGLRYGKRIK